MKGTKLNLVIALIIAVALALGAWVLQRAIAVNARAEVSRSLTTVRDTNHLAIRTWFKDQKAAVVAWADTEKVRLSAQKLLDLEPVDYVLLASTAQQELRDWFRPLQKVTRYRGFFIVGPGNINLASSRDQNVGMKNLLVGQEGFLEGIWNGEPAMSLPIRSDVPLADSHGHLITGLPTMFVAAPIRAETNEVVAIFMFRLDPEEGFTNLLEEGRIGTTGETYAFDDRGRLISPSRFDEQLQNIGLVPADEHSILNIQLRDPGVNLLAGETADLPRNQQPMTRMVSSAIQGESGVDLNGYRDYRGVPVVGAWVWDAMLGLGIATEIDRREAYQTLRTTQLTIVTLTFFVFLLLVGIAVIYSLLRQRRSAETLIRTERDRAQLYLDTVETIIVVLDTNGNVSRINRRGCDLLGYKEDELVGKNWFAACLPAEQVSEVQDVFNAIIRGEKQGVDYFENEVLTRFGERRLIAWHNAFYCDEVGKPVGSLSAGDDITERRRTEEALRESEVRFRLLVEGIGEEYLIFRLGLDETFQYTSPAIERFTGLSSDEAVGRKLWELFNVTPDTRHVLNENFARLLQGVLIKSYEVSYLHPDHTFHTVEIIERPEFDETGKPCAILGIVKDISERKRVEEELRRSATVFENTDEGIMVTNADADIILVNKAFSTITGYEPEEVVGKNPRLHKSGRHNVDYYETMWSTLLNAGQWRGEIWNRRKNGEIYPAWENINVVSDEQGNITNYVAIFSDISVLKQSEERLTHLAHHDTLTSLPNRLRFIANLEQAIESSRRYGHKVALMFLDLDRFKFINDTLGHGVGDQLLKVIAERLKNGVRAQDTVARLGGDEFTVVLAEVKQAEDASLIAEKLIQLVRKAVKIDAETIDTSASIGISIYPDDADDCEGLIKAADTAMYHAKAKGRNNYQFFTMELASRSLKHAIVEKDLRAALEKQEFELYYQPQIDLKDGKLVGVEALIRWNHPEHGQLLPDTFIQIADESGQIDTISEWVLRTALRDYQLWLGGSVEGPRIAVNITGRQVTTERSIRRLLEVLEELAPEPYVLQLDLEITETALGQVEGTIDIINLLRSRGIMFAIDDFGKGHSSLSRLKQLPIDTLKIDRSFVEGIASRDDDKAIAAAIIAMAHSLGLRVIGEGVETEPQLDVLRTLDCDEIQGFYFSRPVPAKQISLLLSKSFLCVN